MQFETLLTSTIYVVSTLFYYPSLLALLAALIYEIFYAGSFFRELIGRIRITRTNSAELLNLIKNNRAGNHLNFRVRNHLQKIAVLANGEDSELHLENLLADFKLNSRKDLDRLHLLLRLGPALGLMGTLVPMGTGLAALGQGDLNTLSTHLVVAFTTTVVGLGIGMIGLCFHTVKNRWVREDLKNIELAAQLLVREA